MQGYSFAGLTPFFFTFISLAICQTSEIEKFKVKANTSVDEEILEYIRGTMSVIQQANDVMTYVYLF